MWKTKKNSSNAKRQANGKIQQESSFCHIDPEIQKKSLKKENICQTNVK